MYANANVSAANPQMPPSQPAPVPTQPGTATDEQLVKQVQSDVLAALRGGQWILSCYSPFKEKPIFPGISDLSPEEARLFIYEAKNTNNLEQAVSTIPLFMLPENDINIEHYCNQNYYLFQVVYINNLFKETRLKYEQLLQPNVNIIKVLRSLYKGELVPSPFSNEPQNNLHTAATSIFRSAVQNVFSQNANNAQSIFSQAQNSIFNPQAADPAKQLFAQANDPAKQLFAQAKDPFGQSQAQNIFAQNTQQQNTEAKSIFALAAQNTFNQTNPSDMFAAANQNIFAREPSQSQNPSPFGQVNIFQPAQNPASIFGQVNSKSQAEEDLTVYSKMEELTDTDLEAYKSDSFQLGYIPELPPPRALCAGKLRTQLFG